MSQVLLPAILFGIVSVSTIAGKWKKLLFYNNRTSQNFEKKIENYILGWINNF